MSSAPTQLAVAPTPAATSTLVTTTAQMQKDFLEEPPLARQNSLGNRTRGGVKGKHLTRSHAMRESASPPRTPTPRSGENLTGTSPTSGGYSSSSEIINDSKMHVQSSQLSPSLETPSVIVTSQYSQQQQQQQIYSGQQTGITSSTPITSTINNKNNNNNVSNNETNSSHNNGGNAVVCNQSQLDVDFPKLTPPKSSKCPRNNVSLGVGMTTGASGNREVITEKTQTSPVNTSPSSEYIIGGNSPVQQQQSQHLITTNKNELFKQQNSPNNNNNNNNVNNNNNSGNGGSLLQSMASVNQVGNNNNSNYRSQHHQCSSAAEYSSNNGGGNTVHNAQTTLNVTGSVMSSVNTTGTSSSSSSLVIPLSSSSTYSTTACNSSQSTNAQCPVNSSSYDNKDNHCSRNDSIQNDNHNSMSESPTDNNTSKGDRLGKKHRTGANSKGSKPRLKNMGSSSSMDGGNSTSGFISRDSSMEQFTDQSGVDLLQFFRETLNKSTKDRTTLMKIEEELIDLAHEKSRREIQFPAMSSYNRMLIHRVAAFFGMEHNVDSSTQTSVIVAKTKSTRIPEIRFKSLCRDRLSDEPRKSILKRDTHSFDDPRQGYLMCPERGVLDRKVKSFEERVENYERTRRRIFRGREMGGCCPGESNMMEGDCSMDNGMNEDSACWPWSSSDSSDQSSRMRHNNKLLKVQSLSVESRNLDGRPSVSKSYSFGGYGGPPPMSSSGGPLARGDSINSNKSGGSRFLSKQDSTGSTSTSWRLSPSSSGYKTQTQSLRSDSVTPSPTGYGSGGDDQTPEPSAAQSPPVASCGIVWAVTDMASVPRGSVLINPQTLQPIVNQDGSIYHFDPSNLPPSQAVATNMIYHTKNMRGGGGNGANSSGGGGNSGGISSIRKKIDCKKSSNMKHLESQKTGNDNNGNGGQNMATTGATGNSIETLSESSAQTVVLVAGEQHREDSTDSMESTIAKENHSIKREMGDIQEESTNNSLDESDKQSTNEIDEKSLEVETQQQQKPKLKNQATSPNIPSPEPNDSGASNETFKAEKSVSSSNNTTINGSPPPENNETNNSNRKEESKSVISTSVPIMSYVTNYQPVDSGAVFPTAGSAAYPATTYQPGLDGNVYALPSPMIYTYPPPMEGEIQGYFMPVYDQTAQRDANGLVQAAPAQALYQSANGTTTIVPVATYPTAATAGNPLSSTPIYQGQVVYSPEQFVPSGGPTSAHGQVPQYQMTYPVGYPCTYNGFWGQAMTYYVPQPPLGNAVPQTAAILPSLPPPMTTGVPPGSTSIGMTNINGPNSSNCSSNSSGVGNGNGSAKRGTPPQHNLSCGQNTSQSVTSATNTAYQFAHGVPLALTPDPNGPTMYAIPQPAVFPNMLPYGSGNNPSATAAGVLTPVPAHQANTAVISPLLNHPGPPIPLDVTGATAVYPIMTNSTSSNPITNNVGTPHSAPSTPLSNPLPLPPPQRTPLFPTPPIIANGYSAHIHHNHYQSMSTESQNIGNNYQGSYEKKMSAGGGNMKGNHSYAQNGRQSSYKYTGNSQNMRRQNSDGFNILSSQSGGNRQGHMTQQQAMKRMNERNHNGNSNLNNNSNSGNGNNNSSNSANGGNAGSSNANSNSSGTSNNNNGQQQQQGPSMEKPRNGARTKPGNLDLRRNATAAGSQRNSPSTNSLESNNNSPNSIASNHQLASSVSGYSADYSQPMYMTRGTHIPPMHTPTAAAVVAAAAAASGEAGSCHQPPLIGTYNHPAAAPAGMYIKCGQAYFAPPPVALPNNRRSPPNELRPSLTPLTGMYPTVNMMLPAPRQMQPRHPNPNYKGNKPSR